MLQIRRLHRPLIIAWVIALLTGEWLIYGFYIGFKCRTQRSAWQRILIVADPQLADAYSYRQSGWVLSVTQFYCDIFMQRSMSTIRRKLSPNIVLYLGDLFDGGREWAAAAQSEYMREFDRFQRVFRPGIERSLFAAGNHDIGFDVISESVFEMHRRNFGNTSYHLQLAGFELVVLDTISLSNNQSPGHWEARRILNEATNIRKERPIILVSHVPLYRDSPCQSQNRVIKQGYGYQYQNLLSPQISQLLLQSLSPSLILSGDDHQSCALMHSLEGGKYSPEHTIATFSWMQGNRHPGFAILDIVSDNMFELVECNLPPQIYIIYTYLFLFICTILLLIGFPFTVDVINNVNGNRWDSYHRFEGNLMVGFQPSIVSRLSIVFVRFILSAIIVVLVYAFLLAAF